MPVWLSVTIPQVTAGILAAIGFWLKAMGDRRDKVKQYERVLARAGSEIEVITAWLQAYTLAAEDLKVSKANIRAEYDLAALYSRFLSAQSDFDRASTVTSKEVSPHYGLAAVSLGLFIPTGIVALIYALLTRRSLQTEDIEIARRRSQSVVTWLWITLAVSVIIYGIALLSSSQET